MESFDFSKEYILENEYVMMRPLLMEDASHLLSFSENEPEIWKYSLVQAIGVAGLKNYIDIAVNARAAKTEYPFIVFDKQSKTYAGSSRFYDIQIPNSTLQLGYTWYGKQFQGTGLNKNCKFLMLEFAFEKMNMERVEFRADNLNEKSVAAMKSIGCTVEGVLRANVMKPDGGRRDSIVLSILKDEWISDKKEKLKNKIMK